MHALLLLCTIAIASVSGYVPILSQRPFGTKTRTSIISSSNVYNNNALHGQQGIINHPRFFSDVMICRASSDSVIEITTPSPDEAAAMGCRDWPQQAKSGTWTENVSTGQVLTRYVLDGTGRVNTGGTKTSRVGPGTLVNVEGEATLNWSTDGDGEMIILTPGFEEGGKLLAVAGVLVVLCAALVAGVGGS